MLKIAIAALLALSSCAGSLLPGIADDALIAGVEAAPAAFCDTAEQAEWLVAALREDGLYAAIRAANKHFQAARYGPPCDYGEAKFVPVERLNILTDTAGAQYEIWRIIVLPQSGHDDAEYAEQIAIFPLTGEPV